MNYKSIVLAMIIITPYAHAIPSMNALIGRLKQIETPKIAVAQAMPWIGVVGTAGTGWGIWSWYKNRTAALQAEKEKAEQETFIKKQEPLESKFRVLFNDPGIKKDYGILFRTVIKEFIQDPKIYTLDQIEYIYDVVMAAHFYDDRNNPSPLELINKPFANGKLPLQIAAEQANVEAVKWLLKKGANPILKVKTAKKMILLKDAVQWVLNETDHEDGSARYSEILADLTKIEKLKRHNKSLSFAMRSRDFYSKIL